MQSLLSAPSSEKSWSSVIIESSMKTPSEITRRKGIILTRVEPPLSSHPLRRNLIFGDIYSWQKNQEKTTLENIKEYRTFNVVLALVKSGSFSQLLAIMGRRKKMDFFQEKS